jgi:outer membrane protein
MRFLLPGKFAIAAALLMSGASLVAAPVRPEREVHDSVSARGYPEPASAFEIEQDTAAADDSFAAALVQAYVSNPVLAATRYDLRATDDELGLALAQARTTLELQIEGEYDLIVPGRVTQASRPLTDRLNDPNIERNALAANLIADQPLYTGGRITSAVSTARRYRGRTRGAERRRRRHARKPHCRLQ